MPLLILHCRTRLFLVIVQHRTILSGARTLILFLPLQEQLMNFTLFPTNFQYNLIFRDIFVFVNSVKRNLTYLVSKILVFLHSIHPKDFQLTQNSDNLLFYHKNISNFFLKSFLKTLHLLLYHQLQ
jgi:hypothetical protein